MAVSEKDIQNIVRNVLQNINKDKAPKAEHTTYPVSYTHLNVYKRQAFMAVYTDGRCGWKIYQPKAPANLREFAERQRNN